MRVECGIKIHLCARLVGLTEAIGAARGWVVEEGGSTVKKSQINALMNRGASRVFARLFYYLLPSLSPLSAVLSMAATATAPRARDRVRNSRRRLRARLPARMLAVGRPINSDNAAAL